jgi:hypothetical protein
MAPHETTKAKEAADEAKTRKQDEADAAAEIKSEADKREKEAIAARVEAKAKARAEAMDLRRREAADIQPPNVPVAGDSDLEAALKALGAEVDRIGGKMIAGTNQNHERVVAGIAAFHPPMPNAEVPPVAPTWKGVSTEDRINYEVDRLAALRRALDPPMVAPQAFENTADAHRAATVASEARTPEQKKADAEAAQRVADAAARKTVGPTQVKAKAMFISDIGLKVSKGDVVTLSGEELGRRIDNGEVTKDLS